MQNSKKGMNSRKVHSLHTLIVFLFQVKYKRNCLTNLFAKITDFSFCCTQVKRNVLKSLLLRLFRWLSAWFYFIFVEKMRKLIGFTVYDWKNAKNNRIEAFNLCFHWRFVHSINFRKNGLFVLFCSIKSCKFIFNFRFDLNHREFSLKIFRKFVNCSQFFAAFICSFFQIFTTLVNSFFLKKFQFKYFQKNLVK